MNRTEKIYEIKKQKYFVKKDIVVFVLIIIILSAITLSVFLFKNNEGNDAFIYSNGELIKVMPLDKDDVFLYEFEGHKNKIVVNDGYIYVEESDCDDQVCVFKGRINKLGDSIICVPHKLVIKIKGEGDNPADL